MGAIVFGLDPGLATLGLAVVELVPGGERVLSLAVFRSQKSKRKIPQSEDRVRRCQELTTWLTAVINVQRPAVICTEAQSWPRNASATAMIGMAWGVIAALAEIHGFGIVQASPQEIKKAVAGNKQASKAEILQALELAYPLAPSWPTPASVAEHAADALAAIVACLNTPVIKMARSLK